MSMRKLGAAMLAMAFASPALAADEDAAEITPYQIVANAPDSAWRAVDPENELVVDLPAGPLVIELRPDFAPKHVEQIKTLVRQGFYNGLTFHRVIEGFVAQGGDPKGDGTGGSDLPNIPAEFSRDVNSAPDYDVIGRDRMAAHVGMVDGMLRRRSRSRCAIRDRPHRVALGAHCPGVMSMARSTDPNSANSQFFLVIGDARQSLDKRYTVWGWIIDGMQNARRINRGEPPDRPTPIVRMRMASDMPASERPHIEVLRTDSEAFDGYIKGMRWVDETGFVKDLCDIKAPRRVDGKIAL
ncbi:MAG: peptidylprolyl isomerase [Parvularculaceae bacterium]